MEQSERIEQLEACLNKLAALDAHTYRGDIPERLLIFAAATEVWRYRVAELKRIVEWTEPK